MEPITRKEKFLAKAGGQEVSLPEPITREEMFLAAAAGVGTAPAPITRKEMFMAAIGAGGGGGGDDAGESGWIGTVASGTFVPNSKPIYNVTVTHNLGRIPKGAAIFSDIRTNISYAPPVLVAGFATDVTQVFVNSYDGKRTVYMSNSCTMTGSGGAWSSHNLAYNATETEVTFGRTGSTGAGDSYDLILAEGRTYYWIVW